MKKVTSSILIGLACASVLSLSVGVQAVKGDTQELPNLTQMIIQGELEEVIYSNPLGYVRDFKANNLKNRYVTDKTTQLSINCAYQDAGHVLVLRDSSGDIFYNFHNTKLSGEIYTITKSFKPGEEYSLATINEPNYKLMTFRVVASEEIGIPTINKVTSQDTSITGTGVPGAEIYLNIGGDDYSVAVDASGNYNISLNRTYSVDSAITLYQEKNGIKSDSVTAKVVASEELEVPKVNKVTTNDTTVTGTALPGATVRLTINGQNFHTIASANGEFSINIEKSYPVNTPIEVYQELNGARSKTIEVYVELTVPFVVNKIKSNSTSITGSGHPNAQITVRIHDEDFSGTIDGNGNFSIDLHGAKFAVGADVSLTVVSSEGTETKTVKIYPRDPTIGIVYATDDDIRGTTDPGATVVITVGGEKYETIADDKGDFRQSVNPNLVVSGAVVTVYTSLNGLESDKVTVVVN